MRGVEAVREVQAVMLAGVLKRPGMYGSGQSLEQILRSTMHLLAFIDERDDELSRAFSTMEKNGLWGPLGTTGAVAAALRSSDDIQVNDVLAAVFARLASQLGYVPVESRVPQAAWTELEGLLTWPAAWPRTPAAIEARFGVPSHRAAGQRPMVLAYAGSSDDAWLFFVLSNTEAQEVECIILPRYPFPESVIDLRPRAISESPEDVYRRFLIASVEGDTATIRTLLVQRTDPLPFFAKPYPANVATALIAEYRAMNVVRIPASRETVRLVSNGCPVPLELVQEGKNWRVDAEPLVRFLSDQKRTPSYLL